MRFPLITPSTCEIFVRVDSLNFSISIAVSRPVRENVINMEALLQNASQKSPIILLTVDKPVPNTLLTV